MKQSNLRKSPLAQQQGMTIIELMVAIFILAILATTAIPAMKGFLAGKTIESVAKIFEQSIRAARSEAADRQVRVSMRPLSNGGDWSNGWQMDYTDTSGATVVIRRVETLSSDLVLSSETYKSSAPLIFDPSGYPDLSGGIFEMNFSDCSNSKKQFTYTILVSGLMKRIQSTNTGC